jgi:hypothetical protein
MKKRTKFLGFDLNDLVEESLQDIFESQYTDMPADAISHLMDRQKTADAMKTLKKRSQKKSDAAGDEAEEAKKPTKIKHEKIPDIDVEKIAEKINAVRAGKSLKDKETLAALKSYFQKLNGPERIALYAFLAGLETVLGDSSGNIKTPHSAPFSIDMEKGHKESGKTYKQPKGSKELSTTEKSESPIIVGESQDKRNILKVIRSNRRRT